MRLSPGKLKWKHIPRSPEENLEMAFQNEIKANVEEYPRLIKDASVEGNKGASRAFSQSRDVESLHAQLYEKAINDMVADRETEYYVCQVCVMSTRMRLRITARSAEL